MSQQTPGFGFSVDGLRVAFRVSWGTFPHYLQRVVKLTVGKLTLIDAPLTVESHDKVLSTVDAILADHPEMLAEFKAAFRQVTL